MQDRLLVCVHSKQLGCGHPPHWELSHGAPLVCASASHAAASVCLQQMLDRVRQTSEGVPCLWAMNRMGPLASSTTAQRGGGTADVRSGVTSSRLPSTTAAVPFWLVLLCRAMLACKCTLEACCSYDSTDAHQPGLPRSSGQAT